MQWEDKKIGDNNWSLLFKARLKNILIKENAYVAKIRITFYLKLFFRKTVLWKHEQF